MKSTRRNHIAFLCLVLIAFILPNAALAANVSADTPIITLSNETAKPGEDVTVAVDISENHGLMVMLFQISYDHSRLSLTGAAGVGMAGWDVNGDTVLWLGDADSYFNGTILELRFRVSEQASSGTVPVTLLCDNGGMGNHDETVFHPAITAGSVTVQASSSPGTQEAPQTPGSLIPSTPTEPATPSTTLPSVPEIPFTDVYVGTYYYTAVAWAYQNGITNGRSFDTFDPAGTCTRAEVVTFLWRAAGSPEPESLANPFADVKAEDYFFRPVLWAVENGITRGTDVSHFSPHETCTTAHIITFIYRALGIGSDGWYREAGDWANGSGLLNDTGLLVDPAENCPRSAVVTFLYRWAQRR